MHLARKRKKGSKQAGKELYQYMTCFIKVVFLFCWFNQLGFIGRVVAKVETIIWRVSPLYYINVFDKRLFLIEGCLPKFGQYQASNSHIIADIEFPVGGWVMVVYAKYVCV